MNKAARLFYHLQQKEEGLEKETKRLELAAHELTMREREMDLTKKEQDLMLRVFNEKLENTKLLFQVKLENLNTLLRLKEEGWSQKFENLNHESKVNNMLHQNEVDNLNHEARVKDWIHDDEIDRMNHSIEMQELTHRNENMLGEIQHQRQLFDLEQTIAERLQDIHLMQQEIATLNSTALLKDNMMGILKEQSVLENKKGQLKDQQMSIETSRRHLLTDRMNRVEEMSQFREEYWNKFVRLNEEKNSRKLLKKDVGYMNRIGKLERELDNLMGELKVQPVEEDDPMFELKMKKEAMSIAKLQMDMAYREEQLRVQRYTQLEKENYTGEDGYIYNGLGASVGVDMNKMKELELRKIADAVKRENKK